MKRQEGTGSLLEKSESLGVGWTASRPELVLCILTIGKNLHKGNITFLDESCPSGQKFRFFGQCALHIFLHENTLPDPCHPDRISRARKKHTSWKAWNGSIISTRKHMKPCFYKVAPSLHFLPLIQPKTAEFLIQLVVERHKLHELPQLLFHVLFYLTQLTF